MTEGPGPMLDTKVRLEITSEQVEVLLLGLAIRKQYLKMLADTPGNEALRKAAQETWDIVVGAVEGIEHMDDRFDLILPGSLECH